jgi:hypothetical protein
LSENWTGELDVKSTFVGGHIEKIEMHSGEFLNKKAVGTIFKWHPIKEVILTDKQPKRRYIYKWDGIIGTPDEENIDPELFGILWEEIIKHKKQKVTEYRTRGIGKEGKEGVSREPFRHIFLSSVEETKKVLNQGLVLYGRRCAGFKNALEKEEKTHG